MDILYNKIAFNGNTKVQVLSLNTVLEQIDSTNYIITRMDG